MVVFIDWRYGVDICTHRRMTAASLGTINVLFKYTRGKSIARFGNNSENNQEVNTGLKGDRPLFFRVSCS